MHLAHLTLVIKTHLYITHIQKKQTTVSSELSKQSSNKNT